MCIDIWLTVWTVNMEKFQFVFHDYNYNSLNIKLCETDVNPAKPFGKGIHFMSDHFYGFQFYETFHLNWKGCSLYAQK